MAKYVIDAECALRIVKEGVQIPSDVQILAPTLLRSQVLDRLFQERLNGELSIEAALALNEKFAKRKFRYLGDAVLRRRAWEIAIQLKMTSTYEAEYIALVQLQADAMIAEDGRLVKLAKPLVAVQPFETLLRQG